MKTRGFFWHGHHDKVVEYCYSYKERRAYIQTHKPANEQELRLRLFKPVKGRLPAFLTRAGVAHDKARDAYEKAENTYDKAGDAYDKAGDAYEKAWSAYEKARDIYEKARDIYEKAGAACWKAWNAYEKARDIYEKARDIYEKARDACEKALTKAMPALLKLHARECKNCPWDGETIFPQ